MSFEQYEFNDTQNEIIGSLAKMMKMVGIFLLIIGIISLLSGFYNWEDNFMFIVEGLIVGVIGFWTFRAAKSFTAIVDTEGNDIVNLMDALVVLSKLFRLQLLLLILGLALAIVLTTLGIIAFV